MRVTAWTGEERVGGSGIRGKTKENFKNYFYKNDFKQTLQNVIC